MNTAESRSLLNIKRGLLMALFWGFLGGILPISVTYLIVYLRFYRDGKNLIDLEYHLMRIHSETPWYAIMPAIILAASAFITYSFSQKYNYVKTLSLIVFTLLSIQILLRVIGVIPQIQTYADTARISYIQLIFLFSTTMILVGLLFLWRYVENVKRQVPK